MSADEVEQVARFAATATPRDIRRRADVRRIRAVLFPVGAVVGAAVVRSFELEHLVLTDWGFREGALLQAVCPSRPGRAGPSDGWPWPGGAGSHPAGRDRAAAGPPLPA